MTQFKEIDEYRKFTTPAELHKAVNTLKGIVAGMTTDGSTSIDEINELSNWCVLHNHLINRHPFNELIPLIQRVYDDGVVTQEEARDIVWLCNNFVSDSHYYDLITSSIQFLFGLIHGVLSDGVITDDEIHALKNWITMNDYLKGTYPFDEIESLLMSILLDDVITDDERNMLTAFLSNFIDLTESYNLSNSEIEDLKKQYSVEGVCAICQEIDFDGTTFCFTGESERVKRSEISEIITSLGGVFKNSVTNKTRYLVVGNKGNKCWSYSCYGRKIEEAIKRRKDGQLLTIVNECDFWDIVDDL